MECWKDLSEIEKYVIRCRRWLHEHAELSDHEEETAPFPFIRFRIPHGISAVMCGNFFGKHGGNN